MSQDRLKQLLSDGSTGGSLVSKLLSLNFNFSFLNRISLLLISSSYPIVLTRLGGPRSRPILPEMLQYYSLESKPGPLGRQSDVLTTIPNRWSSLQSPALNICRMAYRKLVIFTNVILQTHNIRVLYHFFTLHNFVVEFHGLGSTTTKCIASSQWSHAY